MIRPELLIQLLRQKEQLQIDLSIQRDAHDFTDLLIRALLDKSTALEGSFVELERQFLSLASRVCADDRNLCKEKWLLITEQPFFEMKVQQLLNINFIFDFTTQIKHYETLTHLDYPGLLYQHSCTIG